MKQKTISRGEDDALQRAAQFVMTNDADVYTAACFLARRFGTMAQSVSARRAAELLSAGDRDGFAAWLLIQRALLELQRLRRPDEWLH